MAISIRTQLDQYEILSLPGKGGIGLVLGRAIVPSQILGLMLAVTGTAAPVATEAQVKRAATPQSVNPKNLPVITVSHGDEIFYEEMLHVLVNSGKFVVLERSFLGDSLADVRQGNGVIGAQYLVDGSASPLDSWGQPATWTAMIISTESGNLLAQAKVTDQINNFADRSRLVAKLLKQLLASPKLIESLSPANRKSWGLSP